MKGRDAALAILGLLIGTWSTLCGIGGGIFAVPLLHYGFGLTLRAAIANSLALVAASTTSASLVEVSRDDTALHLGVFAVMTASSLAGTRAGYFVAGRIGVRALKVVFAVLLVAVAIRVFATSTTGGTGTSLPPGLTIMTTEYASVAIVGALAGFLAPVLGIGGGLVAVPGLVFGVPALGFASARACSTAMSSFNSWQSLWLYRRDRLFDARLAIPLATGALGGGVVGDLLIHTPAVVAFAQKLLAVTLLLTAARFLWDLRASRAAQA
ncbi:MAG: sulfite exporter TauE/SafE family protein [Planctomycetota bacterium]